MHDNNFKQHVLEKGREIFIKYGYQKTTMNDIAQACHKSKGLIYHHYANKEEIFRLIVKNELDSLTARLKQELKGDDVKEKFKQFIIAWNAYFLDKKNLFHKILQDVFGYIHLISDIIEENYLDLKKILIDILNEGNDKGVFRVENTGLTAESIVSLFMNINNPVLNFARADKDGDVRIRHLITIILQGIVKR